MEKNLNLDSEIIADIQEITLRAVEMGVFGKLFNEKNLSRDSILVTFARWGREFNEEHEETDWGDGEKFYYDEIDAFITRKSKSIFD